MSKQSLRLTCATSLGALALVGSGLSLSASADATGVHFRSCDEAAAAGYSHMPIGTPGYSANLDRDHDGVACDGETTGTTPAHTTAPTHTTLTHTSTPTAHTTPANSTPVSHASPTPTHSAPAALPTAAATATPVAPKGVATPVGPKIQTDGPTSTQHVISSAALAETGAVALTAGGALILMRRRSSKR